MSKTIPWLILFPPYGLYRMWSASCTWNKWIKIAVSVLIALAIAAVIIYPMPKNASSRLTVKTTDETEAFGPPLPEYYDMNVYYKPGDASDNLLAETTERDVIYVYASGEKGSTYYHRSDCKYAYASSKRLTLYEAYMLGYRTPCNLCNPPVYDPSAW